jgi:PhnB protein
MQVNPYIFFNGNCQEALNYYQKVLGARIEAVLLYETGPDDMPTPPEWKKKVMHAKITIDGEVLMASDAFPGHFQQPQGFAVSLQVQDPGDAALRFRTLSDGGTVTMPFAKTFFSKGFGMCVDKFGTPWMVNSPLEGM